MNRSELFRRSAILAVTVAAATGIAAMCSCARNARPDPDAADRHVRHIVRVATQNRLARFASSDDFRSYVDRLAQALAERDRARRSQYAAEGGEMQAQASAPSPGDAAEAEESNDSGDGESITNTQEAGVDEGGIVKTHGDHLVVLRRGRLFSIDLSNGQRRAVSQVDLVPAGSPSSQYGVWYDEMLIHDDTIVVVGYSYESSGTELVLFAIDDQARIHPRGRFHLRSNDYYSSRNYASRIVGDQLIFYMPYALLTPRYEDDQVRYEPSLPAVRVASRGADEDDWREIAVATDVYRPIQPTDMPILHTVVSCDLSAAPAQLPCRARGIIGPHGRNFYVSRDAVYVWVHAGGGDSADQPGAVVYRLPLDQGEISALRVAGAPVDQFSFRELGAELTVLVRSEGGGEWMWGPEVTSGDVALVRMPLAYFDEGLYTVPASQYTALPRPNGYSMQNRYVGDYMLYGTGGGWYGPGEGAERRVYVHPVAGGATASIELRHGVDRIEPMGRAAVVIGSDGNNLHFTSVALGSQPAIVDAYVQESATQGETRSHGFFFKPMGEDEGVLGLPVRGGGADGWEHLTEGSASVLFLRVESDRFRRLGALASDPRAGQNDDCRVSCVDWYGNARPIFYRNRVYALLGYELVEGRLDPDGISEIARTSFIRARN